MRLIGLGRKESWCCCRTNVLYPINGGSKPDIWDKQNFIGGNVCEIGYSTEQMLSRLKSDEERAFVTLMLSHAYPLIAPADTPFVICFLKRM
jgi:hypothetical protein